MSIVIFSVAQIVKLLGYRVHESVYGMFCDCYTDCNLEFAKRKGKEEYLYSAFLHQGTHKALRHGSHSFNCTTPCLPFLRARSPDVTTTATTAADIQLQLTTHLSTQKG